jgi:hypothetical protein
MERTPDGNDDLLDVDDIVTGKVSGHLGEGVIPTRAILVVETISEDGPGLRYVRSEGPPTWQALGMLRSALLHIEHEDFESWSA